MSTTDTPLIRASGGASARRRRPNSLTRLGGPCTSRKTAPESLPTNPASLNSLAIRCTNGRKPTPCTTPVTVNRCRTSSDLNSRSDISTASRRRVGTLFVAAPAQQLQAGHRLVGAGFVGLVDHEAHVDDHPIPRGERFVRQHADVDLASLTGDVDQR